MEQKHKKSTGMKIRFNFTTVAIILLIAGGALSYFQFGGAINVKTVKAGDLVAVDYVGTLNDGSVFDTSKEVVAIQNNIANPQRTYAPLEFIVGGGQMIKGFDSAVVGMKAGQIKKVTLQPEDAYGNVRQDLIVSVNASAIQVAGKPLTVGTAILAENGARGIVTKLENGNATINFNHPLAGTVLNFKITLVKIIK